MKGYVFDTNIFNDILDCNIDTALLSKVNCCATHVQYDEIQQTTDNARRSRLNKVFCLLPQKEIPTSSFVLGESRLGKAKLSNGELFTEMLAALNKKNKNKPNNQKDILIAETAFANQLTLVTHDIDLYLVMTKCGGASCNLYHLLNTE